ncbi:hypothetical protein J6590_039641 [Homalodisca vitripennis]|nr:hypothetical protein J6590_039641 [Homalodisca vitripennis]
MLVQLIRSPAPPISFCLSSHAATSATDLKMMRLSPSLMQTVAFTYLLGPTAALNQSAVGRELPHACTDDSGAFWKKQPDDTEPKPEERQAFFMKKLESAALPQDPEADLGRWIVHLPGMVASRQSWLHCGPRICSTYASMENFKRCPTDIALCNSLNSASPLPYSVEVRKMRVIMTIVKMLGIRDCTGYVWGGTIVVKPSKVLELRTLGTLLSCAYLRGSHKLFIKPLRTLGTLLSCAYFHKLFFKQLRTLGTLLSCAYLRGSHKLFIKPLRTLGTLLSCAYFHKLFFKQLRTLDILLLHAYL